QVEVVLVQVDADISAAVALGNHAGGSGAAERVEADPARLAASEDAAFRELGRHHCEMRFRERLPTDGPDRPGIPSRLTGSRVDADVVAVTRLPCGGRPIGMGFVLPGIAL